MELILTIENGPQPEMSGKTWRCGTEGGTLGRGPDCDLVLPDPKRYTSSEHAVIEFDHDGFTLTDRSTNGTYHNSPRTLIGKNRSVSLDQDDRLFIGDFVLRVDVEGAESDDAPAEPASDATSQFDRGQADDGDADFDAPAAAERDDSRPWDNDEFSLPWDGEGTEPDAEDEAADDGGEARDDAQFSQSPEREYFAPPSASAGDAIPDDWDDFLTGFHDLSQNGKPEDASEAAGESTPRPEADPQPEAGSNRQDTGGAPTDNDRDQPFADAEPAPEERFEPPSAPTPAPREAAEESESQATESGAGRDGEKPRERSTQEPAAPPESSPARAAKAPARGERSRAAAPAPDDQLHEILQVVTEGLMGLLQGRAEIKNEFRIAQTRFVQTENNPLKFSPDADEALERILAAEDSRGFLTGTRAFEDAFDDIQAHQLAILSAVQRAIESAVSQFEPAQIEKKLERISPISAKTPGLKAAKCWSLFSMHYEEVARKMRDDARQLFLAEFAEAYEEACQDIARRKRGTES